MSAENCAPGQVILGWRRHRAPEILRLTFCFAEPVYTRDPLKLTAAIRSELRALTGASSRGSGSAVMYGDAAIEGSTDALTPRVSYRVEGNEVHLRVHLVQGDRTIGDRTITTGTEAQAAAHAATETIVELVRKKR